MYEKWLPYNINAYEYCEYNLDRSNLREPCEFAAERCCLSLRLDSLESQSVIMSSLCKYVTSLKTQPNCLEYIIKSNYSILDKPLFCICIVCDILVLSIIYYMVPIFWKSLSNSTERHARALVLRFICLEVYYNIIVSLGNWLSRFPSPFAPNRNSFQRACGRK